MSPDKLKPKGLRTAGVLKMKHVIRVITEKSQNIYNYLK